MLISQYKDRLEVEWGKLVRVVTAHPIRKCYEDLYYDVYKIDEDGKATCRNIYTGYYGKVVAYPGVKNTTSDYYGSEGIKAYWDDPFTECNELNYFSSKLLEASDRYKIVSLYPQFKYVLNKWNGTIAETIEVLKIWKDFPEVEYLLAGKYFNIVFNRSFWKLTEKKRKEVALYLRKNPYKDYTLQEVQCCIKYQLSQQEYTEYTTWMSKHGGRRINYELYKYLAKQEIKAGNSRDAYWIVSTYSDYKKSFDSQYCFRNFKDPYWKYPADLEKAHRKLLKEIEDAEIAGRINQDKLSEKERQIQTKLTNIVSKYESYNAEINGYSIFVTSNMGKWNIHARELHQCIVASRYYEGMAQGKYLIIFIQKSGKPIATAQVFSNKKIGLFYADEIGGPTKSYPTTKVKNIFNKYLEKLKIKGAI